MQKTRQLVNNIRDLLKLSWREDKRLFIAYFVTAILGAVLLFIVYFAYKLMIDQVTQYAQLNQGNTLVLVIITYLFFEYLSRFVNFTFNQYYFDYFIRMKLQNILTRRFMEKLARMDFALLENGEIRNLIAKVENTYAFRLPEVLSRLGAILYNVSSLAFSFFLSLRFGLRYFLLLALVSAPVYYLRAKYGNITFASYTANASQTNRLWYLRSLFTNFSTLTEIKTYELRGYFLEEIRQIQENLLEDYRKPIIRYTLLSTGSFILVPVAIYFALINFIQGIFANHFTLGDFTFFLNILFAFSGQISSLLINFGSIYENTLFVNDYFRLLNIPNLITVPPKPVYLAASEPREIVFENVSFSYPGSKNLSLKNVSVTIAKGENVAIVGHNGAGKSTFIKLLFRFYDPTGGRILVDGHDLKDIDLTSWYAHIGVLFQDYARYFLTLKDNIRFGNLADSSKQDVLDSLNKAQSEELLYKLPHGLDQVLGRWFENGVELSGGQWQKVAIARAIFRNAPILIMDEPTAAIDADTESAIFRNLHRLYADKNLLFISHRFSTVRTADKIVVLENGEVNETGTHRELVSRNGLYAKFFRLQKQGYE